MVHLAALRAFAGELDELALPAIDGYGALERVYRDDLAGTTFEVDFIAFLRESL